MSDGTAILVTGGAGYIGSHVCKALRDHGCLPVAYDDLSSGRADAVRWGPLVRGDIRDGAALAAAIEDRRISAVLHLAGLIDVAQSGVTPETYWDVNVNGTRSLLAAVRDCGVERLVFSSSAAVYSDAGVREGAMLPEGAPKDPANAYGQTKLACEWMIAAHCRAHGLTAVALRYFNAAGADRSAEIGEAHEPETHLIPRAIAAALGRSGELTVNGCDFATPDGACVRDFVHVSDLADAHVAALEVDLPTGAFHALNLGTGRGVSVLQVLAQVGQAVGRPAPFRVGPRRPGDAATLVADPGAARQLLGWTAGRSSLERIIADALRWELSDGRQAREAGVRTAGMGAATDRAKTDERSAAVA